MVLSVRFVRSAFEGLHRSGRSLAELVWCLGVIKELWRALNTGVVGDITYALDGTPLNPAPDGPMGARRTSS